VQIDDDEMTGGEAFREFPEEVSPAILKGLQVFFDASQEPAGGARR
jgi:hypothetical protein